MFGTRRPGLLLVAMVLACTSAGPEPEPEPKVDASTPEPAPPSKPHDSSAALEEARAFFQLPELAYARAFAINVHTEYAYFEDLLVDDLGQLNPDRVPEAGALLSDAQLAVLVDIVSVDPNYLGFALCFYPHHAVALYDANGEILGELTFCFECSRMKTSFEHLGPGAKFESLRFLLEDLQVPLDLPLPGLPPTLARPIVKQEVENLLDACERKSLRKPRNGQPWRTHGRPPLSFDVHVDERGAISRVVGLDERSVVSACLAMDLLGLEFGPAQAGSVHHFEFRPQGPQPLRAYERPLR
jgi:hypothetical protein